MSRKPRRLIIGDEEPDVGQEESHAAVEIFTVGGWVEVSSEDGQSKYAKTRLKVGERYQIAAVHKDTLTIQRGDEGVIYSKKRFRLLPDGDDGMTRMVLRVPHEIMAHMRSLVLQTRDGTRWRYDPHLLHTSPWVKIDDPQF